MHDIHVLGGDVGQDVLVQKLQHQRDAVGEHQVLACELKLPSEKVNIGCWLVNSNCCHKR